MHLFHCTSAQPDTLVSATSLPTPLGMVGFEAALDRNTVSSAPPSAAYRLAGSGWLACWHQPEFYLELLVCRPTLPAPLKGMPEFPLADCWAGIWRLEARSAVGPCLFAAMWEAGYTWLTGGPNSGEYLYAKTWDDGKTEVTIGTQDEEMLAYRAERGDYLPNEWYTYFCVGPHSGDWLKCGYWQHEAHEQLKDTGVPTPLPSLKQGQRCQIHFVVAWADYHARSAATRLAVDRETADILQGTGCS